MSAGVSWPRTCRRVALLTSKISRVTGTPARPVEHPFAYANTYLRERLAGGVERLRIGLRAGQATVLRVLGPAMAPPYRLLYLLHTSRTGAPLGRYESADLDWAEVEAVEQQFGAFFSEDARHDIWLHSMPDDGTVVLDRYNMVYAYGPLDRFEAVLRGGGVQPVAAWAAPEVPYPHALHYHAEWDRSEEAMLQRFQWARKPLAAGDVQFWSGPQAS